MYDLYTISTGWDVFTIFLSVLIGGFISRWLSSYFNVDKNRSLVLYSWHTLFAFIYYMYTIGNVSDSTTYYAESLSIDNAFFVGVGAVSVIAAPFSNGLEFNFLATTIIFSIYGFIGLLAFDGALTNITVSAPQTIKSIARFIVFFPSISFWSVAISKDVFAFLSIGLFVFSLSYKSPRYILLSFSMIIMFIVRPHIAFVYMLALTVALLFSKGVNLSFRILAIFALMLCIAVSYSFIFEYIGIEGSNFTSEIHDSILTRQDLYAGSGGAEVNLAGMSIPMQLFTYMFRPLPYEIRNVTTFITAIENSLLLVFAVYSMGAIKRGVSSVDRFSKSVLMVYFISSLTILATTTGNLGIAARQKWMILPAAIFLVVGLHSVRNTIRPMYRR